MPAVARIDDQVDPSTHLIISGAPTFFIGDSSNSGGGGSVSDYVLQPSTFAIQGFTEKLFTDYEAVTEGYHEEFIAKGIENKVFTSEEASAPPPKSPEPVEQVAPNTEEPIVACGDIPVDSNGNVTNKNINISKYFNLAKLSSGAVVSKYVVKAQHGLTEADIACNLKNLAENSLDKIKEKYTSMIVTSAFRHGSGTSQHERGMAADMQFPGTSKAEYINIANWIRANVPHDQLILEYKSFGTGMPWIHISLTRKSNRSMAMTFYNNRRHGEVGKFYNLA